MMVRTERLEKVGGDVVISGWIASIMVAGSIKILIEVSKMQIDKTMELLSRRTRNKHS